MASLSSITFAILASTALLLGLLGLAAFLLVLNNNRRQRHTASMAELRLKHRQMVADAEREAVRHSMRDIGRELHDHVRQLLSVAQLGLEEMRVERPTDARIEGVDKALKQGMDEVERLGQSLDTELWGTRSLADAINDDVERLGRVGGIRPQVRTAGSIFQLPTDSTTILYRIFQEVVTHALKHGRADTLSITLAGPGFSLSIADNGNGTRLSEPMAPDELASIRARGDIIGFEVDHRSTANGGTTWELRPKDDEPPTA